MVAYLTSTGAGLVVAPQLVLQMLFSNGNYDDVFVRFSGILMVGLGIVVIQLIRHDAAALYPSTLFVRAIIWVAGVVGAGMLWTGISYYRDRRER